MSAQAKNTEAKIIIRRISGGEGEGHHGGAWKVAYADFVTAMMAFFLLMWLLNATTEEKREGLAEYFNPTIVRDAGASGDGVDAGVRLGVEIYQPDSEQSAEFEQVAQHVQNQLTGSGAESMQLRNLLRHVVTRMTDEGLVIQLSDLADTPLFVEGTAQPLPVTRELSVIVGGALGRLRNQVAISGHVRSYPDAIAETPVWTLSDARAHAIRKLLGQSGLHDSRVQRVTGYADRRNLNGNPMSSENNRIEVILLR